MWELRDYQRRAIDEGLNYLNSSYSQPVIITLPTAAGKSLVISKLAKEWGKPCLVLQPSKELLDQNIKKLIDFGGDATIYSASAGEKELSKLTYATLGSIKDIADRIKKMGVDTVLIDEAHKSYSPEPGSMFSKFMKKLGAKKVIGFTATPFRLKQYMEGSKLMMLHRTRPSFFKKMLFTVQVKEMIDNKFWTPIRYYEHEFDDSKLDLNSTGSEYTQESIDEAVSSQKINETMLDMTKKLLEQGTARGIILFINSVYNAELMAKKLGSDAAIVHAKTPIKERDKMIEDFKNGKIKVMCNVSVLTTGFDYPELTHIIMGYPTNSLSLYYQIIGRVTRIAEGKSKAFFIDLCGNVKRFGRVEDLVIESYPGEGWAVFSGNKILTNKYLNTVDKTKSDIDKSIGGIKIGKTWPWGKFKGKPLEDAPINYIKFILYKSGMDFNAPHMFELKRSLESVLAK
jgi:DNA repair protein RadD